MAFASRYLLRNITMPNTLITRKLDGVFPIWNWTRLMNETDAIFNGPTGDENATDYSNVLGTLSERRFVPTHTALFPWGKGTILTFSSREQFERLLCEELPTGYSYMLSKPADQPNTPWTVALYPCSTEEE